MHTGDSVTYAEDFTGQDSAYHTLDGNAHVTQRKLCVIHSNGGQIDTFPCLDILLHMEVKVGAA